MVVSQDMYYKYKILERCFKIFIKLNQMNERKTLEDLKVKKLTKTIFQSNFYKCMFLILSSKMKCLLNGSFDFFQVSR